MLGMNDLRVGTFFILEGQPFEVLFSQHLKMQQRRPVLQTRIKNLVSGKIIERNFQQSDTFEEANIQKKEVSFLYSRLAVKPRGGHAPFRGRKAPRGYTPLGGDFWFSEPDNPSKRFKLDEAIIGDYINFLKPNTVITALLFNDQIINIELPVKIDFKVIEAPPSLRGNTAQGGTKQVKIETGAKVNVPLFINEGDVIRVNTKTGEYTERVEKK